MPTIILFGGLLIGQSLTAAGLLALVSMYFSWILRIPGITASLLLTLSSVLAIFVGQYLSHASARLFHLRTQVKNTKPITVIATTAYVVGVVAGMLGAGSLVFPLFSSLPSLQFYIVVFAASNILIKLGQTIARPMTSLDASSTLKMDVRPPVLYLRSFSRESRFAQIQYRLWRYGTGWPLVRRVPLLLAKAFLRRSDEIEAIMRSMVAEVSTKMARTSLPGLVRSRLTAQHLISRRGRDYDNEQYMFTLLMNKIGPYIAPMSTRETGTIGDIGAAKLAVPHDRWKSVISDLLCTAGAIVVELDETPGLVWEIEEIIKTIPPHKVLLIIPRTDAHHMKVVKEVGHLFPKSLPPVTAISSRLILFLDDWTPVSLKFPFGSGEVLFGLWAKHMTDDINRMYLTMMKPFFVRLGVQTLDRNSNAHEAPAVAAVDEIGGKIQRQEIKYCCTRDGVLVAYAIAGSGPPIVKTANWLNCLEYDLESPISRHIFCGLAQNHTLIRFDARGNGMSDWGVGELSLDAWVSDLEAVVDAAGLERFPLLGISQGCAVSVAYAVRHPERVSHLILFGGFALGGKKSAPAQIEDRNAMMNLIRDQWGTKNSAFSEEFASQFIPDGTKEQMEFFNEQQRKTSAPEMAARYFDAIGDIDVTDLLPKVTARTLVMHVCGDAVIPIESGRQLAAGIPTAKFVALQGQNHLLLANESASQKFLEEVELFLTS